jgi:hypothetical protein
MSIGDRVQDKDRSGVIVAVVHSDPRKYLVWLDSGGKVWIDEQNKENTK